MYPQIWNLSKKKSFLIFLNPATYFRSVTTIWDKVSRMDQVRFLEDSLLKFLFVPFLNTLSHLLET